ncbi:MAG: exodeoxyribonuclease VII small subunit [Chloroflexi bacterium]|nr:exodeoxyribonuclease VII small subunit [Chloroflexota bacterium]
MANPAGPGDGSAAAPAPTFEDAYAELEQTAQALQQGQLSLDDTLRLYERGCFLARYCLEKLEGVELKISQLMARADGSFTTRPIASEKDVVPSGFQVAPEAAAGSSDSPDEAEEEFLKEQRELFD